MITSIQEYYSMRNQLESLNERINSYASIVSYWLETEDAIDKVISLINKKNGLLAEYSVVNKKIENLNKIDKDILDLYFDKRISIKEVSQKYRISVKTIYRRISKYLRMLNLIDIEKHLEKTYN